MQLPAPTNLRAVVDAPVAPGIHMTVLYAFIALVFGAYATSTAEYLLKYNLLGYTLEAIKKFLGIVTTDIEKPFKALKADEKALLYKFKKL